MSCSGYMLSQSNYFILTSLSVSLLTQYSIITVYNFRTNLYVVDESSQEALGDGGSAAPQNRDLFKVGDVSQKNILVKSICK